MPTIDHFGIPVDDLERAKLFYEGVFEWEFRDSSAENWPLITKRGGEHSLEGGLVKRQRKNQRIVNYIGVPSIEHYANRVQMLGGRVIIPKRVIPGRGYFAMCKDTESNLFALFEDDKSAFT